MRAVVRSPTTIHERRFANVEFTLPVHKLQYCVGPYQAIASVQTAFELSTAVSKVTSRPKKAPLGRDVQFSKVRFSGIPASRLGRTRDGYSYVPLERSAGHSRDRLRAFGPRMSVGMNR